MNNSSYFDTIIMLYSYYSPEMVEGHPYGEKADVWALGCILYQMCALDPPFFNSNMLTLVKSVSFTMEPEYEILMLII